MQLPGGYEKPGTQAAIAVDPQCLVAFTAIGMAATAGIATLAIQVRFDGAALTSPHIRDAFTDGHDLTRQARVREFADS
jgi:hypothetical protein